MSTVETSLRIQAQNILFITDFSPAAAAAVAHLPWDIAYEVVCDALCPLVTVRG